MTKGCFLKERADKGMVVQLLGRLTREEPEQHSRERPYLTQTNNREKWGQTAERSTGYSGRPPFFLG